MSALTLLLVDDDHLGPLLWCYGFTILPAAGGEEALRLYRQHRDAIAAVVLRGPSGPATLDALRQIDPGVRAVFLAGPGDECSREELLRRGACEVLDRPGPIRELADRLGRLVVAANEAADGGRARA